MWYNGTLIMRQYLVYTINPLGNTREAKLLRSMEKREKREKQEKQEKREELNILQ